MKLDRPRAIRSRSSSRRHQGSYRLRYWLKGDCTGGAAVDYDDGSTGSSRTLPHRARHQRRLGRDADRAVRPDGTKTGIDARMFLSAYDATKPVEVHDRRRRGRPRRRLRRAQSLQRARHGGRLQAGRDVRERAVPGRAGLVSAVAFGDASARSWSCVLEAEDQRHLRTLRAAEDDAAGRARDHRQDGHSHGQRRVLVALRRSHSALEGRPHLRPRERAPTATSRATP